MLSRRSYTIRTPLDLGARYVWRVRPFFEGAPLLERAYGRWSREASFKTVAARLGVPRPLAPIDGETVGTDPAFEVAGGTVEGELDTVFVEIQVALNDSFVDPMTARARTPERGTTRLQLRDALAPERQYYWRVRATSTVGSSREVVSPWSPPASFRTAAVRLGVPQLNLPGRRSRRQHEPHLCSSQRHRRG